jgi:putative NIF3 family GTP cyclohydrolase 1 type 2
VPTVPVCFDPDTKVRVVTDAVAVSLNVAVEYPELVALMLTV